MHYCCSNCCSKTHSLCIIAVLIAVLKLLLLSWDTIGHTTSRQQWKHYQDSCYCTIAHRKYCVNIVQWISVQCIIWVDQAIDYSSTEHVPCAYWALSVDCCTESSCSTAFQFTDMLGLSFPVFLLSQTVDHRCDICWTSISEVSTIMFQKIPRDPRRTITWIEMRGIALSLWFNRSSKHVWRHTKWLSEQYVSFSWRHLTGKAWFTIWRWFRERHERRERHGKRSFFHQSNCIPDVKFFDNLIGWTLANARDAMLE